MHRSGPSDERLDPGHKTCAVKHDCEAAIRSSASGMRLAARSGQCVGTAPPARTQDLISRSPPSMAPISGILSTIT